MSHDITSSLAESYKAFRMQCAELRDSPTTRKRAVAESLLPALTAHTFAEEEVFFSRAVELDPLRAIALKTLEEHEVAENELLRLWQSVDDEQFSVRAEVVCDLLELQWAETEKKIFPQFLLLTDEKERDEMATRYREIKDRSGLTSSMSMPKRGSLMENQTGRVGYILAWLLGVPAWLLLMIFLIRG